VSRIDIMLRLRFKKSNLWCCVMQCSVISPRFDVKMKDLEHWTAYLLPSRQFGYALYLFIILSRITDAQDCGSLNICLQASQVRKLLLTKWIIFVFFSCNLL